MRCARRIVAAVFAAVVMAAGVARAQVMSQVPANAMVVVRVKDVGATSQKIAGFVKDLNLQDQAPMMADPLGFLMQQAKLQQGVNKGGDFVFAYLNPAEGGDPSKSIVVLVPTSDYQAFMGNFPDAKADGAVSTVNFANDSQPTYVAKWGDYAAVSPSKEIVAAQPEGLKIAGLAAKEMETKDIVILGNMKVIRDKVLPQLQKNRQQMVDQVAQNVQNGPAAKWAPVMKVAVNQLLNVAEGFMNDADTATFGISIGQAGVSTTLLTEFLPDSYAGKTVAELKNSDQSFLSGLPDGKYLMMGGSASDPKVATKVLSDLIDPIVQELNNVGPDTKPVADYVQAIKDALAAQDGTRFGMVAPQGELGASPMVQFIAIRTGDAQALAASQQKIMNAQQDMMKSFGLNTQQMKTTYTPEAKTVDGVKFDQYHTAFDMNAAQTPEEARAAQMVTFMYGQDGLNVYTGAVNDKTLLTVAGVPDELMAQAITAAKGEADALSKLEGVQSVAGQLPKDRLAAFYFPLDVLVNTGFSYAAKFGIDMGVTMPATDPIGVTVATDGSALRIDSYIPTKLVAGLTEVGKKVATASHRGNSQPAGGPGGL